jgi:hypothetical protein
MGSSLRDIPGAGGGDRRRGSRLGRVGGGPASQPWRPPPKKTVPTARRGDGPRFQAPRWEIDRFNLGLVLAFLVLAVIGGVWLWRVNGVSVDSVGMEDGDAVTTSAVAGLAIELRIEPTGRLDGATVRFDGDDITADVESTDDGFIWRPGEDGLAEGTYELSVEVPRTVFGTATWSMTFGVDDTPPVLDVPPPDGVGIDDAVTVAGQADEAVTLTAEGEPVAVAEDGTFSVTFPTPPAGSVEFEATDRAGNVATLSVPVVVRPPETHGLHLSAGAWADEGLRDAALALVDSGQIDTVVLDLKDECGVVTYGSHLDLATQVGAVDEQVDLADAVDEVHDRGGRLVGRMVVFRDPLLARWAWANGHPDWVLQDTANDPWPAYGDGEGCPEATNAPRIVGGFTNVASEPVWDYNIALAQEAAAAGVDDVLLDDVRRPDGDLSYLRAVGLEGTIADTLVAFLGRAQDALRSEGAYLGATVTGVSVRDPSVYDQDLAGMGAVVDYLAPEVYPESYSAGFFNLPDPQAEPGATVEAALQAAAGEVGDQRTPLVPWLQDYSGAVTYGAAEVQAQVDGAAAVGACSWVVADPDYSYTPGIRSGC